MNVPLKRVKGGYSSSVVNWAKVALRVTAVHRLSIQINLFLKIHVIASISR